MGTSIEAAHLREIEHKCSYCDGAIHLKEEIVIVEVGVPAMSDGTFEFQCYETNEEDDYLYTPAIFHQECCAELWNDREEAVKDEKPVGCTSSVIECYICASDICGDETTAQFNYGRVELSLRSPNGERAYRIVSKSQSYVCIECIFNMNTQCEMWPEIDHSGECDDGRKERCWRTGCKTGCKKIGECPSCKGRTEQRCLTLDGSRKPEAHEQGYLFWICQDCGHKSYVENKNG